MKNKYYVYYSKVCSLPLLGKLIYLIQIQLLRKNFGRHFFASNLSEKDRNTLFSAMDSQGRFIFINSHKFGKSLELFTKSTTICNFVMTNLKEKKSQELQAVMWSVVCSDSITKKTARSLQELTNSSQVFFQKIVVPYHDEINANCDFVFQTVKQLAQKKNFATSIITYYHPISLHSFFDRKSEREFLKARIENVNYIRPIALLPYWKNMPWRIRQINQLIMELSVTFFLRMDSPDILWCFDPEDSTLLENLKKKTTMEIKTLYDCVDYFSSVNKNIHVQIQRKEKRLIHLVDHFFVNSHILKKIHAPTKKECHIVPQGFDQESFSERMNGRQTLRHKRHPIIGFVGNLNYRIDFKLLNELIEKNLSWTFLFTEAVQSNPTEASDLLVSHSIQKIKTLKNVIFLPASKNRRYIKKIIESCDCCIIPYRTDIELNKYSFPMKLMEYFFLGKPVVSTPILELKRFNKFVRTATSYAQWEKSLKSIFATNWPKKYKIAQKNIAIANNWENKVLSILSVIK